MDIDLSTGTPASPERTRHLAETFAEIARVLNHATMDHAAFGSPGDAERVLREIATAASRLPQLFTQAGRWVSAEDGWGCIRVPSGEWAARPHTAVAAFQVRLDAASAAAEALSTAVEHAAQPAGDMTGAEDGGDER